MLTRRSFPSSHCASGNHFNPPRDIPEQLAAYSAQALSTALLIVLDTHFSAGWTEAIWNELSCLRTNQNALAGNGTSDLLITSPTLNKLNNFVQRPYDENWHGKVKLYCMVYYTMDILHVKHKISQKRRKEKNYLIKTVFTPFHSLSHMHCILIFPKGHQTSNVTKTTRMEITCSLHSNTVNQARQKITSLSKNKDMSTS